MKVSHLIYKVQDLGKGVKKFRKNGFAVEYGREKNPNNALIYFSEGPFLELIASAGIPFFAKGAMRLFGKGRVIDRVDYWDKHPGGLCGLVLENDGDNLDAECAILEQNGQKCDQMDGKRVDPEGREQRFTMAYPYDTQLPIFTTRFSADRPKEFVHPNGISRIERVAFGTREELFPLIRELCDDELLELCAGDGIEDIAFEYADGREKARVRV